MKILFFSYLSFLYFCFPKEDQNQNFSIKIVDVFLHIGSFHKFVKSILLFESTARHSLFVYNATWEFQSKVNMKRNTKFRHGKLKSFHRYMKQKKTLYLAKISLMCDFFFFKSAFSKHFANNNM